MIKYILVLLCLMSLSSCVTFQDVKVKELTPYAEEVAFFTSDKMLGYAVSDEDRLKKAEILFSVSAAIESLASDEAPSVEQWERAIVNALPDKPHWRMFADDITFLYKVFRDKLVDTEDERVIMDFIHEVSSGTKFAAERYYGR